MYTFDTPPQRVGTGSTKWDGPAYAGGKQALLPMWVADTDFAVWDEITAAVKQRCAHPVFGYTLAPKGFFQSFIDWNERRNHLKLETDWLLRSSGVISTMKAALRAFTKEGDGVVVQTPVYPPFMGAVKICGRTLVVNPLRRSAEGYCMDFAHLERCLQKGAKMLLLCNPHNPVGRVWSEEELAKVAALCAAYSVTLFSDEIHSDIIFSGHVFTSALAFSGIHEGVVAGASPGKTFNISGLKTSFAIAPNPMMRQRLYDSMDIFGIGSCNLFGYAASEAAYTSGDGWVNDMIAYVENNYRVAADFFAAKMPRVKVPPMQGTFLLWLDFSAYGLPQQELMSRFKDKACVVLNDGTEFGAEGCGHVRMNLGCSRVVLHEALQRIAPVF